ncbi:MAG: stage II sporulation protein M [Betaproteobacteria bacterium]|nr:stage II sporulation protein M [Betaproteobacteria bacterium]
MMTPNEFTQRYEKDWQDLETLIDGARKRRRKKAENPSEPSGALPALYRRVCQHLALARERHYPPALIERLDRLALAGHQTLYAARGRLAGNIIRFAARDFPALVREHARLFWAASALFYLPALAMALLVYLQPEMVYSIFDHSEVTSFEEMYSPLKDSAASKAGSLGGRDAGSNLVMFGFYIKNNTSIGFQCFAAGLLYGVGTLFYLTFNGLIFGAVAAHLIHQESAVRFFQFVIAHSAFELTAIMLCGMAGLMLGRALIAPGRRRRVEALIEAARPAVQIVYGAAVMFFIAAFIEAFWSSGAYLPPSGKFIVGGLLWALVAAYFLFMGKRNAS